MKTNGSLQSNKTSVSVAASSFSGPIPHPDLLRQYEEINPGLADRIMKQAEKQTDHRIEIENKIIAADIFKSNLGLFFGFIIGFTGVAGGIYLTAIGLTNVGIWFSGGSIVTLVGTFVYGSRSKRKALTNK